MCHGEMEHVSCVGSVCSEYQHVSQEERTHHIWSWDLDMGSLGSLPCMLAHHVLVVHLEGFPEREHCYVLSYPVQLECPVTQLAQGKGKRGGRERVNSCTSILGCAHFWHTQPMCHISVPSRTSSHHSSTHHTITHTIPLHITHTLTNPIHSHTIPLHNTHTLTSLYTLTPSLYTLTPSLYTSHTLSPSLYTLTPSLYTSHTPSPSLCTLTPSLYTSHTPSPSLYTLTPSLYTLTPSLYTLTPSLYTLTPSLYTSHTPSPSLYTLTPSLYTSHHLCIMRSSA